MPRQGLVSVYTLEEAMRTDGELIDVTTSNLVNNRWQRKTRTFKVAQYYKN